MEPTDTNADNAAALAAAFPAVHFQHHEYFERFSGVFDGTLVKADCGRVSVSVGSNPMRSALYYLPDYSDVPSLLENLDRRERVLLENINHLRAMRGKPLIDMSTLDAPIAVK